MALVGAAADQPQPVARRMSARLPTCWCRDSSGSLSDATIFHSMTRLIACEPDPWIWGATDQVEVERTFPRIMYVEAVRPRGAAQDFGILPPKRLKFSHGCIPQGGCHDSVDDWLGGWSCGDRGGYSRVGAPFPERTSRYASRSMVGFPSLGVDASQTLTSLRRRRSPRLAEVCQGPSSRTPTGE